MKKNDSFFSSKNLTILKNLQPLFFPCETIFILTYIFLKIIDKLFSLRVSKRDEIEGLDLSQHDETAYEM